MSMSIDDMRAGEELLATPLGHCPEIDPDTRRILVALRQDLEDHRDVYHDPMEDEDGFMCALLMAEILQDLLTRAEEGVSLPESVAWLNNRSR